LMTSDGVEPSELAVLLATIAKSIDRRGGER
jgi:hypothetical protein